MKKYLLAGVALTALSCQAPNLLTQDWHRQDRLVEHRPVKVCLTYQYAVVQCGIYSQEDVIKAMQDPAFRQHYNPSNGPYRLEFFFQTTDEPMYLGYRFLHTIYHPKKALLVRTGEVMFRITSPTGTVIGRARCGNPKFEQKPGQAFPAPPVPIEEEKTEQVVTPESRLQTPLLQIPEEWARNRMPEVSNTPQIPGLFTVPTGSSETAPGAPTGGASGAGGGFGGMAPLAGWACGGGGGLITPVGAGIFLVGASAPEPSSKILFVLGIVLLLLTLGRKGN